MSILDKLKYQVGSPQFRLLSLRTLHYLLHGQYDAEWKCELLGNRRQNVQDLILSTMLGSFEVVIMSVYNQTTVPTQRFHTLRLRWFQFSLEIAVFVV